MYVCTYVRMYIKVYVYRVRQRERERERERESPSQKNSSSFAGRERGVRWKHEGRSLIARGCCRVARASPSLLSLSHLLTTRRMPRLTSMMITARDATIPMVSGICACSRPSHCAPRSGLQTAQGRAHAPALLPCYAQKMKISRDGNFAAVAKPRTSGVQHSLMLLTPASHPTGRLVTDWRQSLRETRREEQGACMVAAARPQTLSREMYDTQILHPPGAIRG